MGISASFLSGRQGDGLSPGGSARGRTWQSPPKRRRDTRLSQHGAVHPISKATSTGGTRAQPRGDEPLAVLLCLGTWGTRGRISCSRAKRPVLNCSRGGDYPEPRI